MPSDETMLRRCAGSVLLFAGLVVGCANVLGLEERTAERDAGAEDAGLDASSDAAVCTSNARTCLGPLQPRVCSAAGDWVDELPCAAGSEECAVETATCVRCAAKPAEVGAWRVAQPVVSASARYFAMAAYDSTRKQVVLFGGLPQFGDVLSDTWIWNGSTWSGALPVTAPSQRFAAAMADDAARGEVVLFGGQDYRYALLSDTWVWNGTSWTRRCGSGQARCGPSPRTVHAMAYDADRKRVVMFGGGKTLVERPLVHVGSALSDTWEWDGATWKETCGETSATPCAIPGLRGASMAYDPVRKRIVLYGGEGDHVADSANLVDRVWEYDGATWSKREEITNVPPPRSFASMTYDTARARVVLHGGLTGVGRVHFSDTWEYDGNCWKDVTNPTALPPPRGIFAAAYDAARAELVVFGGDAPNLSADDRTDTTALRRSPGAAR